jgi:hypothetical protein
MFSLSSSGARVLGAEETLEHADDRPVISR